MKPKSRFKKTLVATLVGTALVGLTLTLLKPNFPQSTPKQTDRLLEHNIALVVDDSSGTRDCVEDYLQNQGYEVIQTETLDEAKDLLNTTPEISRVVSDMDLTKSYQKTFKNYLTRRTEGASLMDWVYNNQINGKLQNIEEFTIHSTMFNFGDPAGFFARPYTKYLSNKVASMTDAKASFNLQPKTVILEEK